ncbi:hypothetical protein C0Q70_17709 [Pomacea canaliculata]|uniref:Uncharacterized protein n=1 Tax=Pomacea canaliculata TaxID=400727 RepID=A0A2T7NL69_POMCA|nr:hypothetical protein C0Q70_17709 [Pomacea canaliculata]
MKDREKEGISVPVSLWAGFNHKSGNENSRSFQPEGQEVMDHTTTSDNRFPSFLTDKPTPLQDLPFLSLPFSHPTSSFGAMAPLVFFFMKKQKKERKKKKIRTTARASPFPSSQRLHSWPSPHLGGADKRSREDYVRNKSSGLRSRHLRRQASSQGPKGQRTESSSDGKDG